MTLSVTSLTDVNQLRVIGRQAQDQQCMNKYQWTKGSLFVFRLTLVLAVDCIISLVNDAIAIWCLLWEAFYFRVVRSSVREIVCASVCAYVRLPPNKWRYFSETGQVRVTHYQVQMKLITMRRSLVQRPRSAGDVNAVALEAKKGFQPKHFL